MPLAPLIALLAIAAADTVFAPVVQTDNLEAFESTKLDIGQVKDIFDGNESTLIRTPSLNPAYVRVEFKKPVSFEAMKFVFTGDPHELTVYQAESLAALKEGRKTALIGTQKIENGRWTKVFDRVQSVKALELNVKRLAGDDYVHIMEWQLCMKGQTTGLTVYRMLDRRDETKKALVDGPIKVPVDTVVQLAAVAKVNGSDLNVTDNVKVVCDDKGVVVYPGQKGQIWVKEPGNHNVTLVAGDVKKALVFNGVQRVKKNQEPDMDVLYIERLPRIAYDGPNKGLPKVGDKIVWRAHVIRWGEGQGKTKAICRWTLDGREVAYSYPQVQLNKEFTVDYATTWNGKRQKLTFDVSPWMKAKDVCEKNNYLTISTDAVTVGLWVERSLWDYMHENQLRLPIGDANSFADWGQRMMRVWNGMFADAKYKAFPDGIKERVRIDKIVVVPDFALPLAGGLPSNNPDNRDKTLDMVWGMEGSDIAPDKPYDAKGWWSVEKAIDAWNAGRIKDKKEDPPFWCGLGYIHEMNHARYLVDSYGFNVHSDTGSDPSKWSIKVQDENGPIMGRYLPLKGDLMWSEKHVGIMGGDYWKFSAFEAMCWNRVRGQRARGGNCNSPEVIGEFLNDIPKKVVLQFVDAAGKPLSGAEVVTYRAHGTGNGWYTKVYENEPALKGVCDVSGKVSFDRTLWAANGKIEHTYGISQSVALLRVTYQGKHYFLFECVADSNIAYNLGFKDEVVFKRQIRLRSGDPKPEEWDPRETWEVPGGGFEVRP